MILRVFTSLLFAAAYAAGGEAKSWWAFQPLAQQPVPEVRNAAACRNDVDRFIQARLEAEGVAPAPSADARTLVRRAAYDLTGLPPEEEMEKFTAAPDFLSTLNSLLSTPSYGEHWGRHWLDVARYADTAGETADIPLPHMWRYRNWVFDALNRDLPYDEFVRLQLAGDIIRRDTSGSAFTEGVVATGYLALARRFGFDTDKDIHLMHEDVIDNTGKAFLGLTISCARCHDHKYDPVTMHDYYALYGIFASTRFSYSGCEKNRQPRDLVPLLSKADAAGLRRPWEEKRARTTPRLDAIPTELNAARGTVMQAIQNSLRLLADGEVKDGGSVELPKLERIVVKKGELLHLAILPLASHGADTTRVEWDITAADGRRWSVGDLLSLTSHPHPGTQRAPAQWVFMDWRNGPGFLSERVEKVNDRAELQAWRNGDTPSVLVNSSEQEVKVWTALPPRAFFMHPGSGIVVGLEWVSPLDGEVTITGRITDAHPGGPDGIGFRLEHLAAPDAGPALVKMATLTAEQTELTRQRDDEAGPEPAVPVAFAVAEAEAKNARLHDRGDPEKLRDEIPRRWLTVLGGEAVPSGAGSGRRELAEWIVRSPLSTRVIVNRVWQWHFGRGLVRTPNDFGLRGERPTHPELLEWLCAYFEKNGRSLKALHRLIMDSAAWQRSSSADSALLQRDPDNRLLARFERHRLSAEEIRDSLLAVSGTLDRAPGEAHPFPEEKSWNFTQHGPFNAVYDHNKRSAYLMVQRQRRHPFLALFDGSDPNASTPERQNTTAPTQALFFLNDPFFHTQAAALAKSLASQPDDAAKARRLFRTALQREPSAGELEWAASFLAGYPAADDKWPALCRVMLAGNEFMHVD